jgi:hypothetical protein
MYCLDIFEKNPQLYNEIGLYRVSGNIKEMDYLQENIISNNKPDVYYKNKCTVYEICGLIKRHMYILESELKNIKNKRYSNKIKNIKYLNMINRFNIHLNKIITNKNNKMSEDNLKKSFILLQNNIFDFYSTNHSY